MASIRHAHCRPLRLLVFCSLVVIPALPAAWASDPSPLSIETIPPSVINGHVLLVEIDASRANAPVVGIQGRFGVNRIPVFRHPGNPGVYIGLIGIPYRSAAGPERLTIEWTDRGGYHRTEADFAVKIGRFRSETLRVSPQKVQPGTEAIERIRTEKEAIRRVYARGHPMPLWRGAFRKPLDSPVTSPYGSRRLFNGQLKSYHSGVDFRASIGTPIPAANDGIVRMTRDLFFSGNHVIVDHGAGIFTNYSHLEEFRVRPGQHVLKGETIGLAGATGRVNGPHLHWGAKVHGVSVNPLALIEALNRLYASDIDTDEPDPG